VESIGELLGDHGRQSLAKWKLHKHGDGRRALVLPRARLRREQHAGTQADLGPYEVDTASPTAGSFDSFSSSGGAIAEPQFNNLGSGLTAQLTVARHGQRVWDKEGNCQLPRARRDSGIFDEGSGNTAYDFSGNGNNGTLLGSPAPQWVAGKFGTALSFNNSSAYVEIPNSRVLTLREI